MGIPIIVPLPQYRVAAAAILKLAELHVPVFAEPAELAYVVKKTRQLLLYAPGSNTALKNVPVSINKLAVENLVHIRFVAIVTRLESKVLPKGNGIR